MKTYHVYIETSQEALDEGGPLAHLPELPGCTARARTVEDVREAIRRATVDYIAFLREQGEADLPDEFQFEFEEVKDYTLPPDLEPLTPAEMERARRWLERTRQQVLAELEALPEGAWDWKPEPNEWSLRSIVGHLGNAELYLTDRLMEPERAPIDRLQLTHHGAMKRLDCVTPERANATLTFGGETWTLRKVMRRLLEHEQEHLAQIRERAEAFRGK